MDLGNIGKILVFIGSAIIITGGAIILFSKIHFFGRLSGDIYIRTENINIYFPIVTSILISIVLTVVLNLVIRIFLKK